MNKILLLCERGVKMKRLLCVVLVVCLALPWGGAFAAEGGDEEWVSAESLLLDVPLGISVEECIALVLELAGIALVVEDERWWSSVDFTSPNRELRLCGEWTSLGANFDEGGMLRSLDAEGAVFVYQEEAEEEWREFTAKHLQNLLLMLDKAEQNFGEVTLGSISIDRSHPGERPWSVDNAKSYTLPMIEGKPDKSMLSDLFEESFAFLHVWHYFRDGVSFSVILSWDKIGSIAEHCFNAYIIVGVCSEETMHRMQNEPCELYEGRE